MLLWDLLTEDHEKRATWSYPIATAIASILCGMVWVFGGRVLHRGLAALFFGLLLIELGAGLGVRRARKKAETR